MSESKPTAVQVWGEAFERIRRRDHRMGPDVPYWVQDHLDIGYDMLVALRGGAWRGGLLAAIAVTVWSAYAFGHGEPLPGLSTCLNSVVNGIFLGAMIMMFIEPWLPKRGNRHGR